jgi:hypothetical protein
MTEAPGYFDTALDVIGLETFVAESPRVLGCPPEDFRALATALVTDDGCSRCCP